MVTRKEVPPRTMNAVERFLKEAKAEGFMTAEVGFTAKRSTIANVLLVDYDGNRSFYWYDNGEWFDHVEVE